MSKDAVEISACAPLLVDAHNRVHDERTASVADDSGEAGRNAKHYMQAVLNANMELEASQAAGVVLNIPSSGGSIRAEFHSGWDYRYVGEAVRQVYEEGATGLPPAVDDAEVAATRCASESSSEEGDLPVSGQAEGGPSMEGDESASVSSEMSSDGIEPGEVPGGDDGAKRSEGDGLCVGSEVDCGGECSEGDEAEASSGGNEVGGVDARTARRGTRVDLLTFFNLAGGEREGLATIFRDANGELSPLTMAHHYALRDPALGDLNAHEFRRAFWVRKMQPADFQWLVRDVRDTIRRCHPSAMWIRAWRKWEATDALRPQLELCKQQMEGAGDPTPLTFENATGRKVLVPRYIWRDYVCDERGGEGWEATIRKVWRGQGRVNAAFEFTYATDADGRRYPDELLDLAVLVPLGDVQPPPSIVRGRPRLDRYRLMYPHPLRSSYIIIRRAKLGIPALIGAPPPKVPPEGSQPTTRVARRRRRDFARFYVANFVPWSASSPPDLTYDAWCQHVRQLENEACLYTAIEGTELRDSRARREIAAARLVDIENLTCGFVSGNKHAAVLPMKHRARMRTLWTANYRPDGADDDDACTSAEQRAASKELQRLREKADRLRGTKDISARFNEAQAKQEWAKSLVENLRPGRARASEQLRSLWHAAAAPANRTTTGVARRIHDVSEANKRALPSASVAPLRPDESSRGSALPEVCDIDDPFRRIDDEEYERLVAQRQADMDAGLPVGDAPLNPEQRDGGRDLLAAARRRAAGRRSGESAQTIATALADANVRTVRLAVGMGGAGKSAMVHALDKQMRAEGIGHLLTTAYTGVAAAPFGGPTLLALLKLSIRAKCSPHVHYLTQSQKQSIRDKFFEECGVRPDDIGGIVVDEVSFNELELFGHLDARLRAILDVDDVLCGGIPIVLCGDNHQKPPPGGTAWYRRLVQSAMDGGACLAKGTRSAAAKGLALLREARRVQLKRNMRVEPGEEAFVEWQLRMRDTSSLQPVPGELLRRLRPVSKADVAADAEWRFAPIGVLSHVERDTLNHAQIEAFARAFNVPLVKWPLPMVDGIDDDSLRTDLYAAEPSLWGYFVEGAPIHLTETIRSVRKLVNGTPALLDSLSFEDDEVPEQLTRAIKQGGFRVVELASPPKSVNVRVGGKQSPPGQPAGSAPGSALWHGIELEDLSELVTFLTTGGEQVIPLLLSNNAEGVPLNSFVAAQRNLAEVVLVRLFQYQLAFALTDFKLQGRTLRKLILSICKRSRPPWMTLSCFYVLISRVRTFGGLRLLQHDSDGLAAVASLKHDEMLYAWEHGYDKEGTWCDQSARAALHTIRRLRQDAIARAKAAKEAAASERRRSQREALRVAAADGRRARGTGER